MPRHTQRLSRSGSGKNTGRYSHDDRHDDDGRYRRRRSDDLPVGLIIYYVLLVLLPLGVPILAYVFRPMAGFGPDLKITWAVLLGFGLFALGVITVFAVPRRNYWRTTFLIAWAVIGYVTFLSLMGARVTTVVGWSTAQTADGRMTVDVPRDVSFSKPREGNIEYFRAPFGALQYVAGYRDLPADEVAQVRLAIDDGFEVDNPFQTEKVEAEDGTSSERYKPVGLTDRSLPTERLSAYGVPGRRWINRGEFVVDVYLDGSRLYFLAVIGPSAHPHAIAVKKFLASFRLKVPESTGRY